ncbi:uncharacterized protein LOC110098103 isoform X3 [Dendrobium catenatum]|uniref:uncharacterized protein LOC110098103 isoform X3 n=1 Tax=Dendrobium catenatum TaxID=906689 RepID=UPI0009F399DD|nr:uncharacterized protein LOC110098103 isoform X3 [Dendrobium catenatum]
MREGMMSVLLQHPQNLLLQGHESFLKTRLTKVQGLGSSGVEFPSRGTPTQTRLSFKLRGRNSRERLVSVHVVPDDAEGNSLDDESLDEEETSPNECKEVPGGLSREDLERIVGQDESAFSGVDLARLIRNKYGRSYDVQLIKKEFMGRNLLAMNVMWKYMEQAVSIFIDMDESGGRSNEWIYK